MACELANVLPRKLKIHVNTCFASRVVLFQKTLELKHGITFCYKRQQSLALQGRVPSPQVWAIAQVAANRWGPWFSNAC
jgi:hypothetical protein